MEIFPETSFRNLCPRKIFTSPKLGARSLPLSTTPRLQTRLTPLIHTISTQPFHPKLKTLLLTNKPILILLLPTSIPVSTPNAIHHSRLAVSVCLPNSLDLTCCLATFLDKPL